MKRITALSTLIWLVSVTSLTSASTDKVTICHKGKTKEVPPSALSGHLGHGDGLCSCEAIAACDSTGGTLDPISCACIEPTSCEHALCEVGVALSPDCGAAGSSEQACIAAICNVDPFCCAVSWDGICVAEVTSVCGQACVVGPAVTSAASFDR